MLSRMRPARALATRAAAAAEEFATGTSSAYADAQYLAWQRDPASVHSSWASYFASGAFALPPQLGGAPAAGAAAAAQVPAGDAESTLQGLTGADTARAMHLIAAYQRRGHERADLDPLRLAGDRPRLRDLDPATYGFEPGDADRPLRLASAPGSAVAGCVEINQRVGCTSRRRVDGDSGRTRRKFDFHTGRRPPRQRGRERRRPDDARRARRLPPRHVPRCVEINQCVGSSVER